MHSFIRQVSSEIHCNISYGGVQYTVIINNRYLVRVLVVLIDLSRVQYVTLFFLFFFLRVFFFFNVRCATKQTDMSRVTSPSCLETINKTSQLVTSLYVSKCHFTPDGKKQQMCSAFKNFHKHSFIMTSDAGFVGGSFHIA